ncbi:hypothetical protein C8R47DRAFT_1066127 [Mycena vitilis]|nr:hypothetical protein C8R47DRAFT_1066127 [Mycena vitilis]
MTIRATGPTSRAVTGGNGKQLNVNVGAYAIWYPSSDIPSPPPVYQRSGSDRGWRQKPSGTWGHGLHTFWWNVGYTLKSSEACLTVESVEKVKKQVILWHSVWTFLNMRPSDALPDQWAKRHRRISSVQNPVQTLPVPLPRAKKNPTRNTTPSRPVSLPRAKKNPWTVICFHKLARAPESCSFLYLPQLVSGRMPGFLVQVALSSITVHSLLLSFDPASWTRGPFKPPGDSNCLSRGVYGSFLSKTLLVIVLFLHDWASGARVPVPLLDDTCTVDMKVFWRDPQHGWILAVISYRGLEFEDEVQLFAVDPVRMSVSFLASVSVPYSLDCTETSFALVDDERFLLVTPLRIELYRWSTASSSSQLPGGSLSRIGSFPYSAPRNFQCPPLGPIVTRIDGTISFSICTGKYLQRVSITPAETPLTKPGCAFISKRLADDLPVDFSVSSGLRIGVFRLPSSSTIFTTSSVLDEEESLLPFFYPGDHRARVMGSVVFMLGEKEYLETDTLQVDEEQGRVMFMVRSRTEAISNVIVLELV